MFLGRGPQYPWGGLYGGQIVAQGLRAGAATVEERFHVHSLHAYFIRPGDADEPIRFEVTRSRDGRSFCTRHVVASQEVGVILTMSLSFQVDEAGHDVQTARDAGGAATRGARRATRGARCSSGASRSSANVEEGRGVAWLRMRDPVGDDRCSRPARWPTCPTTSPPTPWWPSTPTVRRPRRASFEHGWMSASLDHAIWFHRPPVADEWHIHDFTAHGYLSSRGLGVGHILSRDGIHVATVAQEVLLATAPMTRRLRRRMGVSRPVRRTSSAGGRR